MESPRALPKDKYFKNILIRDKYSNVPVNVPLIYPTSIKKTEATLECFDDHLVREFCEIEPDCHMYRTKYPEIKKYDDQNAIGVITRSTQKALKVNAKKKKGTMFVSELWSDKQINHVLKHSRLGKAQKCIQEIEREGLNERLGKLEKNFEKRKDKLFPLDPEMVLQNYVTPDSSPSLKNYNQDNMTDEKRMKSLSKNSLYTRETEENEQETENTFRIRSQSPKISEMITNLFTIIQSPHVSKSKPYLQPSRNALENKMKIPTLQSDISTPRSPKGFTSKSPKSSDFITDQDFKKENTYVFKPNPDAQMKRIIAPLKLLPINKLERGFETSRNEIKSTLCMDSKGKCQTNRNISQSGNLSPVDRHFKHENFTCLLNKAALKSRMLKKF